MSRLFLHIVALASSCVCGVNAIELTPPDYLAYVSYVLPAVDAAWSDNTCTSVKPGGGIACNPAAALAAVHIAYFNETRDIVALERASHLLLLYVDSWRNATANGTLPNRDVNDFFACRPVASAAAGVLGATSPGLPPGWTSADVQDLLTAAGQVCAACCQVGQFNQAASRGVRACHLFQGVSCT